MSAEYIEELMKKLYKNFNLLKLIECINLKIFGDCYNT